MRGLHSTIVPVLVVVLRSRLFFQDRCKRACTRSIARWCEGHRLEAYATLSARAASGARPGADIANPPGRNLYFALLSYYLTTRSGDRIPLYSWPTSKEE
jgi:hypothetical protein